MPAKFGIYTSHIIPFDYLSRGNLMNTFFLRAQTTMSSIILPLEKQTFASIKYRFRLLPQSHIVPLLFIFERNDCFLLVEDYCLSPQRIHYIILLPSIWPVITRTLTMVSGLSWKILECPYSTSQKIKDCIIIVFLSIKHEQPSQPVLKSTVHAQNISIILL